MTDRDEAVKAATNGEEKEQVERGNETPKKEDKSEDDGEGEGRRSGRVRRQVTRFSDRGAAKNGIPQGKGTKIKDMPDIEVYESHHLRRLHKVMYGEFGESGKTCRDRVIEFSGFVFGKGMEKKMRKQAMMAMDEWTIPDLKEMLDMFGISYPEEEENDDKKQDDDEDEDEKEEQEKKNLMNLLMKWLDKPVPGVSRAPKDGKKSRSAAKRKRASNAASSKKRKQKELTKEEEFDITTEKLEKLEELVKKAVDEANAEDTTLKQIRETVAKDFGEDETNEYKMLIKALVLEAL